MNGIMDTVIRSKSNPLVKELSALKDKKGRERTGSFLVEGGKMVEECSKSGLEIKRLIVREGSPSPAIGVPAVVLGHDAFAAVADAKTPQSVMAEVAIPRMQLAPPEGPCLYLDGVSDPANVGAIIRTAAASGYCELYLDGCADPYSPKSVRASMSGVFFVKLMKGSKEEIFSALEGVPLIAADMHGENVFAFNPPEKYVLAIGNEGNGLSEETFKRAAFTVSIPMEAHTESLNAAVSAGITMYALKNKR